MSDNSRIWDAVKKTDPSATKTAKQSDTGRVQTSIDGYYMLMRATETFGPLGIGWGYEILEERLDDGAPAFIKQKEDDQPIMVTTKVHTIKLRLWYKLDGEVGEIVQYGHTPALYRSKWGVSDDGEVPKKSLMDAIKKSLSMLGFCADVFTGQFDDRDYVNQVRIESDIEKAEDREAEIAAKRAELTDVVKQMLETVSRALSAHELKSLFTAYARSLERQKQIPELADIAGSGLKALARDVEKRKTELEEKK